MINNEPEGAGNNSVTIETLKYLEAVERECYHILHQQRLAFNDRY